MGLRHFNSKHIKLDEVDSTNAYLQQLNKTNKQNCGTFVSAVFQRNGRGQKGNKWDTKSGDNLTFSVVVYPDILTKYAFYLNIITALAIQKTMSDLNIDSKIKWPNDLIVNDKKICGILIENQISGSRISQSVIGIGLNVNQLIFNDYLKATSLILEGVSLKVEDVLKQIYGYLDFYYNLLKESNFDLLLKHYYSNLLWLNKVGVFENESGRFNAKVIGITDVGMLNLVLGDGSQKAFDLKEIKFIY